jgi:DNA-binding transcriptional LysR family regulator
MTMELRSDRLQVLVAVNDAGGFSRAAATMGLSQSSVSQAVAALERDVGEPLFTRAGRGVRLTVAGRALVEHSRLVLVQLAHARDELLALRDVSSGTLALGTSDTLATHLLPPVFAKFRARHPGVDLRLDNRPSPAIAAAVASGALDLGVVSLPLPPGLDSASQALTQVPLVRQRDVVITPRRHALARRAKVRFADLAPYPLVLLDRTTASRAWLEAHFAAAHVTPHVAMEMSSVEVLKRLVSLGFGVSVVPSLAVNRGDGVVSVPLAGVETWRQVGLVHGPSPTRATRAFIDLAREVLGAAYRRHQSRAA